MQAARSNPDFAACGNALLRRDDARLNESWQKVMALASAVGRRHLLDEQRAWLLYRDRACLLYEEADDFGREGQVIRFPSCRAEIVEARIGALQAYEEDLAPK